jgi:hypothetical protein
MPTCIHCGTSSDLLTYDTLGLCHHCSPEHAPVIAGAMQGIADAAADRAKKRKAKLRLEALQVSIEHCDTLLAYPRLQLNGINPQSLRGELETIRAEIVEQAIRDQWFEARERAKDAGTYKKMYGSYAGAVKDLQDLMDYVDDASTLEKAVIVLRAERDALVFETICRDAQLAEQQGRATAARNLYIEAAFELRKDGTPDAYQVEKLEYAEKQIARLGGRPKPKAG